MLPWTGSEKTVDAAVETQNDNSQWIRYDAKAGDCTVNTSVVRRRPFGSCEGRYDKHPPIRVIRPSVGWYWAITVDQHRQRRRNGFTLTAVLLSLLSPSRASPKAIDLMGGSMLTAHEPNYCNRSSIATTAGLLRSPLGQFLGFPCSNEFFHCRWQSDGYRTYKKNCPPGLVYDTLGTQNCNYDYNVKGCAISSDPAKCKANEFHCQLSEKCVSLSQRCDGKYDCMLEEDEQNCPVCKPSEFPCVVSEQCIPMSGRCNAIQECQDGTDEQECDACDQNKFLCRKSGKCISSKLRCDGAAQCPHGEDELLCKKSGIGAPFFRMYACENRQAQVPRNIVCDGVANCPDASDEKYCNAETSTILYNNEFALSYDTVNDTVLATGHGAQFLATVQQSVDGEESDNTIKAIDSTMAVVEKKLPTDDNGNQSVAYSNLGVVDESENGLNFQIPQSLSSPQIGQIDQNDRMEGDFEPLNMDIVANDSMKNDLSSDTTRFSSLKTSEMTNPNIKMTEADASSLGMSELPSESEPPLTAKVPSPEPRNEEHNQFKEPDIITLTDSEHLVTTDGIDGNLIISSTALSMVTTSTANEDIDGSTPVTFDPSLMEKNQWRVDPLANPWQTEETTTALVVATNSSPQKPTNKLLYSNQVPSVSDGDENTKKPKRRVDEESKPILSNGDIDWRNRYETGRVRHAAACRLGEDIVDGKCVPKENRSSEAIEHEILRRFTTKYGRKARDILEKIETILLTRTNESETTPAVSLSPIHGDFKRSETILDTQNSSISGMQASTQKPSVKKYRRISTSRVTSRPKPRK